MKLIHKLPKGNRKNYGWRDHFIDFDSPIGYCDSYRVIFNKSEQEKLLAQGKACIFTDNRFHGFPSWIYLGKTTKSIERNASKLINISSDEVTLTIDNRYCWRNRAGKYQSPELQIIIPPTHEPPEFEKHYGDISLLTDPKAIELAYALKENGFFFRIYQNTGFLAGGDMGGCVVMVYGENKRIGLSEFNHSFLGYSYGCDNILWDYYDEFDKWSRCYEIPKTTNTNEIIEILKTEKSTEE
jgi:hypothetical protein